MVHVDYATLTRLVPGGLHETASGQVLSAETIQRLTCDASVTRIVFDPAGLPLDVGRSRRTAPLWIRRAVVARDRHCVFPDCDRPHRWCDVHHLWHWTRGGRTAVRLCILLCRYHHTLVHEGGFTIVGTPGELAFLRPDGTPLRAPP